MKKIFIILSIILLILFGQFFYIKFFSISSGVKFFNVGQGDAALIKFANGEKMLVDCGPDTKVLSKLGFSMPFYDRTIDYLVVSHPDLDHYGGCADVLKRYKVRTIIINSQEKNDPYFKIWKRAMENEKANVLVIDRPQNLIFASTSFWFFAPDQSLKLNEGNLEGNNSSLVFKFTSKEKVFLFTGDMELPVEKSLVEKYCNFSSVAGCKCLNADILKIGHHGSDSSSGYEFLQAVNPKQAVVSVGKNKFGHPSLRVTKRMGRLKIDIWRTDEKGDVIVQ